jgi:cellulose biosynthesis protein BcsQ
LNADIVLMDVGPNLGAINRASLIASDHVVMPLAPGLFSLQGLRNLGPALISWRASWRKRLEEKPDGLDIPLPAGDMKPSGYVIMQHVERRNRPVKAYQRWISRIPSAYSVYVLGGSTVPVPVDQDEHCVGFIKNYQSLMPLAEDARKPVFKLTAADGAIGAHAKAVAKCYLDFRSLTERVFSRAGLENKS